MRYRQINNYYLEDTITGRKITFREACRLLNQYEDEKHNQRFEVLK